jgi:NAD(P)-dependent dehydrogenase (short-subunit alcohol dehydrogenase family)
MVAAAVKRYGRLDILHNNVGIVSHNAIREETENAWDRVLAVNLKSMMLTTQAALPYLEAAGGEAIINVYRPLRHHRCHGGRRCVPRPRAAMQSGVARI